MASRVCITANFQLNLDAIRTYLVERETEIAFDRLITRLFDEIMPNFARFPRMGRDFLAREPLSDEGAARRHALKVASANHTDIRECITDEYLLLYAVRNSIVHLLSIRHHRQLSFDFRSHWL